MSVDPSLPSDEPSDEASNHADKVRALWNTVRDLLGRAREAFRELKEHEASVPWWIDEPADWVHAIDDLITADLKGCWADDAMAWDKQALANARQAAAELREGR